MVEQVSSNDQMSAITISREYGSGGGEIAARLASRLGWTLVDHQIVANVAQRLGMTHEEASARDERGAGLVSRVLDALLTTPPDGPVPAGEFPTSSSDLYHQTVCRVIEKARHTGRVVIVGRGAQALLQASPDVLHVRVIAPIDMRIAYVSLREGLTESQARARIHSKEQGRNRYLKAHYHRTPQDPDLYDVTINTRGISLDDGVEIIINALEHKARMQGVPATERWSTTEASRYRARPGDLHPI